MTVKVAINGFGRIGRNVLRAIVESGRKDIEVVAINDLGPVETNAHLLRFDSVHGRFPSEVKVEGDIDRRRRPADQGHRDQEPGRAAAQGARRRHRARMHRHLHRRRTRPRRTSQAGAKRVLVSAPADGADLTVVYGVNHDKLTKDHLVVSNASCTTNCLAPVAKVLNDAVGIEQGLHDDDPFLHQRPADARQDAQGSLPRPRRGAVDDPDLDRRREGRRPRAARTQGQARRHLDPRADAERLGRRLQVRRQARDRRRTRSTTRSSAPPSSSSRASSRYTDQPNVSIDFNHDPHSSTCSTSTRPKSWTARFVRVMSWYDNEWGFSNRMADTAVAMAKLMEPAHNAVFTPAPHPEDPGPKVQGVSKDAPGTQDRATPTSRSCSEPPGGSSSGRLGRPSSGWGLGLFRSTVELEDVGMSPSAPSTASIRAASASWCASTSTCRWRTAA